MRKVKQGGSHLVTPPCRENPLPFAKSDILSLRDRSASSRNDGANTHPTAGNSGGGPHCGFSNSFHF